MNPLTIQLVSAILQGIIQLSYVVLTGYGIRQGFVYLTKRLDVLGESERIFPRRVSGAPTDAPVDLLDTATEELQGLGLRSSNAIYTVTNNG